jgi:hypothetical protein
MSIATSKPSNSTKKSRVSAVRSDLMFGTALLIVTLRVLSEDLPITPRDAEARHEPSAKCAAARGHAQRADEVDPDIEPRGQVLLRRA